MAANLLRACDALERAVGINHGLNAIACLMRSARDADAPSLEHLSELLFTLHEDMERNLDDIRRCIDK